MENYKYSSKVGQEMILTYLKNRMKEQKMTNKQLAELLEVSVTTLWRYFNMKADMPLGVYLKICGALKLRSYLIPVEMDNKLYELQTELINYEN